MARRLILAVVLTVAALGSAIGVAVATHTASVDVRVAARSTDSGSVEVAIQQRMPDGSWSDYILPGRRYFTERLHDGAWRHATPVRVQAPLPAVPDGGPLIPREPTLDAVIERGELRCGVRQDEPPFGLRDRGSVSGFDVEFCRAIAAAVLGDPAKVDFVDASRHTRLELLGSGAADVLITPVNAAGHDRMRGVDFAPPILWTELGFLVRGDSPYETTSDLDDITLCVHTGSSEVWVADHFTDLGITYAPLGGRLGDVADAFFSGRCDALAADRAYLAGRVAARADAAQYRVLPQVISREPLAPAVREDDGEWREIVSWVVHGLIAAEELGVTRANVAALAADPPDSIVSRLLGAENEPVWEYDRGTWVWDIGFGRVGARFIQRAIAAVGNYGEIYARTIGDVFPRACTLNALAIESAAECPSGRGGLIYALPYR